MPYIKQYPTQKTFKNQLLATWQDFISSMKVWRIFCLIGANDIRKRYSRSRLGQFWLSLSLAVNILTLGMVWSYLFKIPIKEYLPFIATSMILWSFISSCLAEGANLYINSASYLKELNIPKLSYVNSLIVRNLIVLGHNFLVLVPIYLFCLGSINLFSLSSFILGLLALIVFLYGSIIIAAIISLRFRDFPNIISSLLQILFYVTPVMWKIELMPEKIQKLLILNPFCVFLTICKNYLLSGAAPEYYWSAAIIYILISFSIATYFFSKFRSRIIYWI